MKNRFTVIYAIFASAVFIFAMTFFGFNLFKEYKTNYEKSEKKFNELVSEVRKLSFSNENNDLAYSNGIKDAVGDAGDYSYIHVRRNNETVILYPTGKSKEETISNLTKSYTKDIIINKQPLSIDCNIYLIRPDSIFYYARISFLMILIITIITIIMIIYLSISENNSDVISLEETEESEESDDSISTSEESDETNEGINSEEEIQIENQSIPATEENSEPSVDTEVKEEENISEPEEEKHTEVTPEEVKAILAEPLTDADTAAATSEPAKLPLDEIKPDANEPSGLYNPDTGIGWESYLSSRLNNEIERATASEIDLSLFVFKLTDLEKTNENFKNVCNYLAIQFQFKDLLFEYKDDCIVAIKISMNVDEALNLADKLYHDICNIINSNNLRIGISSRSIRMVGGDRLLLEAEQAIEHADESSPVIAFRVDSEKYRQLMEQNQ